MCNTIIRERRMTQINENKFAHISVHRLEMYFIFMSEEFKKQRKYKWAHSYTLTLKFLKVLRLVYKKRKKNDILPHSCMKVGKEKHLKVAQLFGAQFNVDTSVHMIRMIIQFSSNLFVVPCKIQQLKKILAQFVGFGSGYKRSKYIMACALKPEKENFTPRTQIMRNDLKEDVDQATELIHKVLNTFRKDKMENIVFQTIEFDHVIVKKSIDGAFYVPKITVNSAYNQPEIFVQ